MPTESHPEREEQKLRYFKDPECRVPLFALRFEEPVTVGEIGEQVVYAKNITNEELTGIVIESEDPNVKFEIGSATLKPQESTTVKIIASPKDLKPLILKPKVKGTAIARGYS